MSDVRVLPHLLFVVNAVDVPDEVQREVMALLAPYNPDCYERACNAAGMTS